MRLLDPSVDTCSTIFGTGDNTAAVELDEAQLLRLTDAVHHQAMSFKPYSAQAAGTPHECRSAGSAASPAPKQRLEHVGLPIEIREALDEESSASSQPCT